MHRERKSRRQKNFDLIQEGIVGWEALRRHDTPAARRTELVQSLLRKLDGRLAELAASPTASRVVQALIKYGSETDRANILKQLEPQLLELAKNAYARFVLSKLINVATKDQLQGRVGDLSSSSVVTWSPSCSCLFAGTYFGDKASINGPLIIHTALSYRTSVLFK